MRETLLFVPIKLSDCSVAKKLLDSLLDNGYFRLSNFGVVLVDDGNTTSNVKKLSAGYPVQYFRTSGIGKMAALNYAVKKTLSKYLVFTDQDNIVLTKDWIDILKSNLTSKKIGYVSGRVISFESSTETQIRWEEKGALNKGSVRLELDRDFFRRLRLKGVPVNLCTVGSNHIMPRKVFEEIGFHDERFGPGASIEGAGGDLDVVYRVLRAGYKVIYEPRAVIGHVHPKTFSELRKKMYFYGISDTAIHFKFFIEFGDFRGFFQFFYRILQNAARFIKSFFNLYPLPPHVALASVFGNLVGPLKYLKTIINKK